MNIIYNNFLQYLSSIDIEPMNTLKDNSVSFKRNSLNYIFEADRNDPAFFRIVLPNIDDYNASKAETIRKLSAKFKVAKLIVVNQQICIVAEQFVYSPLSKSSWFIMFDRIVNLLNQVIDEYRELHQR